MPIVIRPVPVAQCCSCDSLGGDVCGCILRDAWSHTVIPAWMLPHPILERCDQCIATDRLPVDLSNGARDIDLFARFGKREPACAASLEIVGPMVKSRDPVPSS